MSLAVDDGLRVYVDGADVTSMVDVSVPAGGPFDVTAPDSYTLVNGDFLRFDWIDPVTGAASTGEIRVYTSLSGIWRITRGPTISPEDYAIIDDFIIDSVVDGHARRL